MSRRSTTTLVDIGTASGPRDLLPSSGVRRPPSISMREGRVLSFLLAERKESTLGKERKEPPGPPAAREGRDGTAVRDPLSPPWTFPSLDLPLSPALGRALGRGCSRRAVDASASSAATSSRRATQRRGDDLVLMTDRLLPTLCHRVPMRVLCSLEEAEVIGLSCAPHGMDEAHPRTWPARAPRLASARSATLWRFPSRRFRW
jgi:hypothetical protein